MVVADVLIVNFYLCGIFGCYIGIGMSGSKVGMFWRLWLSLLWPIGIVAAIAAKA